MAIPRPTSWALAAVALIAGGGLAWSCMRGGGPDPAAPAVIDAGAAVAATDAAAVAAGPRWLKGNLHTHTDASRDSHTDPRDVIRWYVAHDYDFVVFTDHNLVTPATGVDYGDELLVMPGVELTHNPKGRDACDPPPPEPHGHCRIHVNALFVDQRPAEHLDWSDDDVIPRLDKYQLAIDQAEALGGLVQINHPNWHWGIDGAMLAELGRRGALLVEIANQAFVTWNVGREGKYPSMDEIWDAALTAGATVWGVASDDAHNYYDVPYQRERGYGYGYPPGYGFVMVWAESEPAAIRQAIAAGRFYASTGALLDRAEVDAGSYLIEVAANNFGPHEVIFIGAGGQELARHTDVTGAAYRMADAPPGYVRAVVINKYGQRAWTQPVRTR